MRYVKFIVPRGWFAGPWLVRVRRVQLHPSILGNGCMHPSIFRPDTIIRVLCPIFPTNGQFLHPSIELSNKGTAKNSVLFRASAMLNIFCRIQYESIFNKNGYSIIDVSRRITSVLLVNCGHFSLFFL